MSAVLLTGGTGFVGRHALAALASRGADVHAVHHGPVPADLQPLATWHEADLLDVGQSRALVAALRPERLLHLAWYAAPGFWSAPENYRWVEASLALLRAFTEAGGKRAVAAGTCAEYDWSHGWCSEGVTPLAPSTTYGVCKDAVRRVMEALCADAGASAAWGRLFFLYGPHERPERLVPSVVRPILAGQEAACTPGEQVRDFLHARDAGEAFAALLESDVTGAVNVASGRGTAVRDLALAAARAAGRPEALRVGALPSRPGDPPLLVADVRRLANEVGWSPRIDLEEGMRESVGWWRSGGNA
ncbi:MAG TPA: NAD(P)-dependent oxidoreductase [Longimicrobium sp.]|nr:NAD(P)-dependent oxidoreductase [Longimicrobium sp.]